MFNTLFKAEAIPSWCEGHSVELKASLKLFLCQLEESWDFQYKAEKS